MDIFSQFFDWWGRVTHTTTKQYTVLGKPFSVNWPIVTFIAAIWIAMLLFLPW